MLLFLCLYVCYLHVVTVFVCVCVCYKGSWAPKNWCFWTVVLEKTLESPLDWKEIQPVNPKGNETLILSGRTDAEAETPILWPPDAKNWLTGKDPNAGKYWRQEENGMTEDEMVKWHHQFNRHEFEQALGVGDGQGSLVCCGTWGHKESDSCVLSPWISGSIFWGEAVWFFVVKFFPMQYANLTSISC